VGGRRVAGFACAWLLLAAAGAPAQPPDATRAFVEELVGAVNSKSLERRRALLHPASRACPRPELIDEVFARQAERTVPAAYRWTSTPVPPEQPPLYADKFEYAVGPSHVVQIDYESAPTKSVTLFVFIAHDGQRWREVLGCPTAETVAQARAAKAAESQRAERVRALVTSTSPGLREAVLKLYREGHRIDAYKHYERVSGEDLATARDVVELLAGAAR
jgi:hypothetical protein